MARPRKEDHEIRNATVRARVTPAEREFIEQQAANAGLTPTDYVRARLLHHRIIPRSSVGNVELIRELKRSGNNLNQQTAKLHKTSEVPEALRRVWAKHEQLLDLLLDDAFRNR